MYSPSQNIASAVRQTERDVLKRNRPGHIEARAIEAIRSKVAEARDLLVRWIRLQEQKPGQKIVIVCSKPNASEILY